MNAQPSPGAFSNQFLEGMKQLYELEPFIKVKPYLTNQWEKGGRLVKTASWTKVVLHLQSHYNEIEPVSYKKFVKNKKLNLEKLDF